MIIPCPAQGKQSPWVPGGGTKATNSRPKIILADDHNLVRESLRSLLEMNSEFVVVAEAATGDEVVQFATELEADLLITDVIMPGMTGLEAVRRLRELGRSVPALFLTSSDREDHVLEALTLGAVGYVHKSVCIEEFLRSCRRVLAGHSVFIYPSVVESRLSEMLRGRQEAGIELTEREKELVRLVASGHTSREISAIMFLSVKTVERHRSKLLAKLGLKDRLELCRYALRVGIIEP